MCFHLMVTDLGPRYMHYSAILVMKRGTAGGAAVAMVRRQRQDLSKP